MNYLAHAYLSFGHSDLLIGNMISDFVKGRKQYDYPPAIQKGIRLHRLIDQFTDQHSATQAAKQLLKPAVGTYAGAFVDVVYDHFLATDPREMEAHTLQDFASSVYHTLLQHQELLPLKFAAMVPFMAKQNWLFNYQFHWGIERSFEGVARRALYTDNAAGAFQCFLTHYEALQQYYLAFFPEVKKMAREYFDEHLMP